VRPVPRCGFGGRRAWRSIDTNKEKEKEKGKKRKEKKREEKRRKEKEKKEKIAVHDLRFRFVQEVHSEPRYGFGGRRAWRSMDMNNKEKGKKKKEEKEERKKRQEREEKEKVALHNLRFRFVRPVPLCGFEGRRAWRSTDMNNKEKEGGKKRKKKKKKKKERKRRKKSCSMMRAHHPEYENYQNKTHLRTIPIIGSAANTM